MRFRRGRILEVQVKAIKSSTWQLNAGHFLEVDIEDGVQFVRGPKAIKSSGRVCIFIVVKPQGNDEFYILRWGDLQEILYRDYKGGARPKNPETLHHALHPTDITQFRDNWDALD